MTTRFAMALLLAVLSGSASAEPCAMSIFKDGGFRCVKPRGAPADAAPVPELPPPMPPAPRTEPLPPPSIAPPRRAALLQAPGGWRCKAPVSGHALECRQGVLE